MTVAPIRTVVQHGPKDKKVAAVAIDWPGWSRGAKDPGAALELLEAYRDRYRPVATRAGLGAEFDGAGALRVVEDHVGNEPTWRSGSASWWIRSFRPPPMGSVCKRGLRSA